MSSGGQYLLMQLARFTLASALTFTVVIILEELSHWKFFLLLRATENA